MYTEFSYIILHVLCLWSCSVIIFCTFCLIFFSLSKADIDGMIEESDRNGDGMVSLEEFIDTMKRTALFC